MKKEYDFSQYEKVTGNRIHKSYLKGHSVKINRIDGSHTVVKYLPEKNAVVLEPDVRRFFPDTESVNEALRTLIRLVPGKINAGKRMVASL
jgi:hypothetical protein